MATFAAACSVGWSSAAAIQVQPSGASPTQILVASLGMSSSLWHSALVVMMPVAPECSAQYARSDGVSMVMQGIGMAPIRSTATMPICHWGMRGSSTITLSPCRIPCSHNRLANWEDLRLISSKVKLSLSPAAFSAMRASLPGSAAQRSTTSKAKLKVAGSCHRHSAANARLPVVQVVVWRMVSRKPLLEFRVGSLPLVIADLGIVLCVDGELDVEPVGVDGVD